MYSEKLTEEFSIKYEMLGLPLASFAEDFWKGRKKGVLKTLENLTLEEEGFAKLRELVLVLRSEELEIRPKAGSGIHSGTSGETSYEVT
jgi:hypothetical protein